MTISEQVLHLLVDEQVFKYRHTIVHCTAMEVSSVRLRLVLGDLETEHARQETASDLGRDRTTAELTSSLPELRNRYTERRMELLHGSRLATGIEAVDTHDFSHGYLPVLTEESVTQLGHLLSLQTQARQVRQYQMRAHLVRHLVKHLLPVLPSATSVEVMAIPLDTSSGAALVQSLQPLPLWQLRDLRCRVKHAIQTQKIVDAADQTSGGRLGLQKLLARSYEGQMKQRVLCKLTDYRLKSLPVPRKIQRLPFAMVIQEVYRNIDRLGYSVRPLVHQAYTKHMHTTLPLAQSECLDMRRLYTIGCLIGYISADGPDVTEAPAASSQWVDLAQCAQREYTRLAPGLARPPSCQTCYMNVIVQLMYAMPRFTNELIRRSDRSGAPSTLVLRNIVSLVCYMQATSQTSVRAGDMIPHSRSETPAQRPTLTWSEIVGYQSRMIFQTEATTQQDAHELWIRLYAAATSHLLTTDRSRENFGVLQITQITDTTCPWERAWYRDGGRKVLLTADDVHTLKEFWVANTLSTTVVLYNHATDQFAVDEAKIAHGHFDQVGDLLTEVGGDAAFLSVHVTVHGCVIELHTSDDRALPSLAADRFEKIWNAVPKLKLSTCGIRPSPDGNTFAIYAKTEADFARIRHMYGIAPTHTWIADVRELHSDMDVPIAAGQYAGVAHRTVPHRRESMADIHILLGLGEQTLQSLIESAHSDSQVSLTVQSGIQHSPFPHIRLTKSIYQTDAAYVRFYVNSGGFDDDQPRRLCVDKRLTSENTYLSTTTGGALEMRLVLVVYRIGTQSGGHYFSVVIDPGDNTWYTIDDEMRTQLPLQVGPLCEDVSTPIVNCADCLKSTVARPYILLYAVQ